MRRSHVFALLVFLATSLGGMGSVTAGEVAVLMAAPVDVYEDALRGFKLSLRGHQIGKTHQMKGEVDRGREALAGIQSGENGKKPDLVFAVGVWALQAALKEPIGIPVVYAMVLNPPSIVGSPGWDLLGQDRAHTGLDVRRFIPAGNEHRNSGRSFTHDSAFSGLMQLSRRKANANLCIDVEVAFGHSALCEFFSLIRGGLLGMI